MIRTLFSLLAGLLLNLPSWAQSGANPAVTNRNLLPNPLPGVGATFTLSFRIGNSGAAPISGAGEGNTDRMQFGICLGKCAPNPASTAALSGPLLTYFDVVYNATSNCFEGRQKQNVVINPTTVFSLSIAALVTSASSNTAVNDIGASCNIAPNGSANPQPTDDDFASVYTHTVSTAMPVALVDFAAQAQVDGSVLVSWKTSWERHNQGYTIERSKDLLSYEAVGQVVDVAGSSNSGHAYRFVDAAPYRGTSYYRLRQTDTDGTSSVFPAKAVVIEGQYGVYPNPVVGHRFTLMLDEPLGAVLHLYNEAGAALEFSRSVATDNRVTISFPSSPRGGLYLLTVAERGITRQYRLLVQP